MGHRYDRVRDLFDGVSYTVKSTEDIRAAMAAKVVDLRDKSVIREQRMAGIRMEFGIDAERLSVLLMRYKSNSDFVSYEDQGTPDKPLVPAGVIANLVEEREMIDNERRQIQKLELVLRNLRDEEMFLVTGTGEVKTRPALHKLDDHELTYLGF